MSLTSAIKPVNSIVTPIKQDIKAINTMNQNVASLSQANQLVPHKSLEDYYKVCPDYLLLDKEGNVFAIPNDVINQMNNIFSYDHPAFKTFYKRNLNLFRLDLNVNPKVYIYTGNKINSGNGFLTPIPNKFIIPGYIILPLSTKPPSKDGFDLGNSFKYKTPINMKVQYLNMEQKKVLIDYKGPGNIGNFVILKKLPISDFKNHFITSIGCNASKNISSQRCQHWCRSNDPNIQAMCKQGGYKY